MVGRVTEIKEADLYPVKRRGTARSKIVRFSMQPQPFKRRTFRRLTTLAKPGQRIS